MSYFLVPTDNGYNIAQVAHIVRGTVNRLAPLGIPFSHLITVSDGYVAGLEQHSANLRIKWARIGPDGVLTYLPTIGLPPHLVVSALALHGSYLYVGGTLNHLGWHAQQNLPTAGRFNLGADTPVWEPLELPRDVETSPGKAIDDVLVDSGELILVDDLVFPKYLFVYALPTGAALPSNPRIINLPFGRVYEHIHKGQVSPGYVALYSTSTGMFGNGTYVSVLRRGDYTPLVVFAYEEAREELSALERMSPLASDPRPCPFDLALQDHTLVVACPRALVCVDLRVFERPSVGDHFVAENESIPYWDYPTVDLRDPTVVPGVTWVALPLDERPDGVRFVGPGQLLLTASTQATGSSGMYWLKKIESYD